MKAKHLFSDGELSQLLNHNQGQIRMQVNRIPKDQFMNSSDGDLFDYIYDRNSFEPIKIHDDKMVMEEPEEFKKDVSHDSFRYIRDRSRPFYVEGTRLVVEIPFTGEKKFFEYRPNTWSSVLPFFEVRDGKLIKYFELAKDDSFKSVRKELLNDLNLVKQYLEWQKVDLETYHASLPSIIESSISARRDLLRQQCGMVEQLGIPLKKKEGPCVYDPIRVEKKISVLPLPPKDGYTPEPGISGEVYGNVLGVIRASCESFERTPRVFSIHGEEELRDIMLANLNSLFQVEARGEVFNKSGKTDIYISKDGRNAFVGECKIWRGKKVFTAAIDQLLSYLTWRDCKTALIILNTENTDFTGILSQIESLVKEHPLFIRLDDNVSENEWAVTMQAHDDESRRIQMRIMIFNLYVPN